MQLCLASGLFGRSGGALIYARRRVRQIELDRWPGERLSVRHRGGD